MITPTPGPLRPPRGTGFMSANTVLPLFEVLGNHHGASTRDRIFHEAGLRFLPGPEDPVRERQVCQIHQSVRRMFPTEAREILEEAGLLAADVVAQYRIPASGKMMLRRLPWPLATWMLMRSAQQHAWAFGGSARFATGAAAQMELTENPLVRGERAKAPICHFHRALFERLFRALVHPRMTCIEHSCEGAGGDACRFELRVPADGAEPA